MQNTHNNKQSERWMLYVALGKVHTISTSCRCQQLCNPYQPLPGREGVHPAGHEPRLRLLRLCLLLLHCSAQLRAEEVALPKKDAMGWSNKKGGIYPYYLNRCVNSLFRGN